MNLSRDQLHQMAVDFCQRTGSRPVAVIELAMTEAAAYVCGQAANLLHVEINNLIAGRETANRDNRPLV
jgi:hypothetical protein